MSPRGRPPPIFPSLYLFKRRSEPPTTAAIISLSPLAHLVQSPSTDGRSDRDGRAAGLTGTDASTTGRRAGLCVRPSTTSRDTFFTSKVFSVNKRIDDWIRRGTENPKIGPRHRDADQSARTPSSMVPVSAPAALSGLRRRVRGVAAGPGHRWVGKSANPRSDAWFDCGVCLTAVRYMQNRCATYVRNARHMVGK